MDETTKTLSTVVKPARFQIAGELDGFAFTVTFRGKVEVLKDTIAKLKASGATPANTKAAPVGSESSASADAPPPMCPHHSVKMKQSRKPGIWFCPKKDGDEYCDYKVQRR